LMLSAQRVPTIADVTSEDGPVDGGLSVHAGI
jgi:hypothetical protein